MLVVTSAKLAIFMKLHATLLVLRATILETGAYAIAYAVHPDPLGYSAAGRAGEASSMSCGTG